MTDYGRALEFGYFLEQMADKLGPDLIGIQDHPVPTALPRYLDTAEFHWSRHRANAALPRCRRPSAAPTRHARQGRCFAGPTDARTCRTGARCRRVSGNRSPSWADPTAPRVSPLPCSVRLVCRPGRARSLRRTGRVWDARGGPVCRAVSRSTVTHMSLSTTPGQSALMVISLGRQRLRGRPREGPGPPVGCHM